MLCVMALERHGVAPASGPVVVTGAAGGVGSVAVSLLHKLGYEVAASPAGRRRPDYLRIPWCCGDRSAARSLPGTVRPLAKERWAGGIGVVGSTTLANVLSMIRYGGAVAACGLAGGVGYPHRWLPFILRGVSLLGIDSVMCPQPLRQEAWNRPRA